MTKIEKELCGMTTVTLNKGEPAAILVLPDAMSKTFGEIKLKLLEGTVRRQRESIGILFPTDYEIKNEKIILEIEEQGSKRNAVFKKYNSGFLGMKFINFGKEGVGNNNLDWPTFLKIKEVNYDKEGNATWVTFEVYFECYCEKETFWEKLHNRIKRAPKKPDKLLSLREILQREKAAG